jgi:hypothetical protein
LSLTAFLRSVAGILDEAEVPWMLTGSLAASYYAIPRTTRDVDVVVDASEGGIGRVVDGLLRAGYYVDREAALEAWRRRGQFNAIDPRLGWKVDLIVRKDRPFSVEEFSRRRPTFMLGIDLALASFEDVILAKMEWASLGESELQRRDVEQLVQRGWSQIDLAYLERWIVDLGLEAEWKRILERLGKDRPLDDGSR